MKVAVKHLGLVRSGLQSVDMDQIRSRSRRIQIQVSLQPIHRQILGLVGTLVISLVSRLPAFNIFPSQGFRQDAVNCNGQSVHIYIYLHYFTIFYPPDQSHPTKRILLRRTMTAHGAADSMAFKGCGCSAARFGAVLSLWRLIRLKFRGSAAGSPRV